MAQSIIGATTNMVAEVEPLRAAIRSVTNPPDYQLFGSYRKAMTSGTIGAGLSAGSIVYAFRWAPAPSTAICLVKHVRLSVGSLASFGATPGFVAFNLFVGRPYTTLETSGGTAGTFTGNNAKLRTNMATSAGATCYISTTGNLSGGTSVLDTDPISTVSGSVIVGAGVTLIVNGFDLWGPWTGEQPLILNNIEGFQIQATVPGNGTWKFGVEVQWDEMAVF